MKTVANCVEEILIKQPFLEDALNRNIINYSALAEELQKTISKTLKKPIKTGAIVMALRRYKPPIQLVSKAKLNKALKSLGNITVQSNISDFTFKNSNSLIQKHLEILEKIKSQPQLFYTFTRGILESNVLISSSYKNEVENVYKTELCTNTKDNLSAITIALPTNNTKVAGLYYQFFKRLAWEGISLYEVVSTTNEFTILVEDEFVDSAFSAIKSFKKN